MILVLLSSIEYSTHFISRSSGVMASIRVSVSCSAWCRWFQSSRCSGMVIILCQVLILGTNLTLAIGQASRFIDKSSFIGDASMGHVNGTCGHESGSIVAVTNES